MKNKLIIAFLVAVAFVGGVLALGRVEAEGVAEPSMACQAKARVVDGAAVVGWLATYNSIGCPQVTVSYVDGTNWFLQPVLFE